MTIPWTMSTPVKWFGYRYINGTGWNVRRYFNQSDLDEAEVAMDYTIDFIVGPFIAASREQALEITQYSYIVSREQQQNTTIEPETESSFDILKRLLEEKLNDQL